MHNFPGFAHIFLVVLHSFPDVEHYLPSNPGSLGGESDQN